MEISCVFTWDKERCEWLHHQWEPKAKRVIVGGPAYDDRGGEFEPGRYVKKGIVHTSRGCPRRCPWCYVWKREGKTRELGIQEGNIVEDSNLLACSRQHIEKVHEMLKGQKAIKLNGGIDSKLLRGWHIDAWRGLKIKFIFTAYDDKANRKSSLRAISRLRKSGFSREHIRCFVMIGRNETRNEAEGRLRDAWHAGALPFAQLYDGLYQDTKVKPRAWQELAWLWSRPAVVRSIMHKESK